MNATLVIANNLQVTLSWIDYTLFFAMLSMSVLIGLYFGCSGHQNSAKEYLLGSKEMAVVPIAISLVASNISGVTILGVPNDTYEFGCTYILYTFMLVPIFLVTYYVFLPVFYKLQLVSTYEYLMLRFDRKIRLLASGLYTISNLLFLPIVVYIPALALAHTTDINLHVVTPIICAVCIFYTTIGGLKAVVWTDAVQFIVMIGGMIGVFYKGLESVGGFGNMWRLAKSGRRLDFDFDLNPTKKDTVLATLVGTFFMGLCSIGINQSFVQKYLSLPTKHHVKKALYLYVLGMILILSCTVLTGLVMYARYHECDPFTAGKIAKQDQTLPYYVMDVASTVPGLAGLFLSGLFSAALSTLSACMNSLAGSVYEDFVSPFMPKDISQKNVSNILKLMVLIIGVISTALVFVVEHMGSIFSVNFCLMGITQGTLLGLFTLGMLFPVANSKGAIYGSLSSMAIMMFIILGNRIQLMKDSISYEAKPVSIEGCNNTTNLFNQNLPLNGETGNASDDVFILFRITYYYYTCTGTFLTVAIGCLVSHFTRTENDPKVDPDLISPVSHWVINRFGRKDDKGTYLEVNNGLNLVTSPSPTKQ